METSSKETQTHGKLIHFHKVPMAGEYDKSTDFIEYTFKSMFTLTTLALSESMLRAPFDFLNFNKHKLNFHLITTMATKLLKQIFMYIITLRNFESILG